MTEHSSHQIHDAIAVVANGQLLAASSAAAWLLGIDAAGAGDERLKDFLSASRQLRVRKSDKVNWRGSDGHMYRLVAANHNVRGSSHATIVKFESLDAPSPGRDYIGAAAARGLSHRQVEVFSLLARGLTDSEIGRELRISYDTVRAHVRAIFRKLNVSSRIEAVNAVRDSGHGAE